MKKKDLIEKLKDFNDDDHIEINGESRSYTPKIKRICGKGQSYTVHHCVLPPNHEGECYSSTKDIYFVPDGD